MKAHGPDAHVAAIYGAAWWLRYYRRPMQAEKRAQALLMLGLAVREAFNTSEHFEPLLYAICDALADMPDLRFAVKP